MSGYVNERGPLLSTKLNYNANCIFFSLKRSIKTHLKTFALSYQSE